MHSSALPYYMYLKPSFFVTIYLKPALHLLHIDFYVKFIHIYKHISKIYPKETVVTLNNLPHNFESPLFSIFRTSTHPKHSTF